MQPDAACQMKNLTEMMDALAVTVWSVIKLFADPGQSLEKPCIITPHATFIVKRR